MTTICCHACKGSGRIELTGIYAEALTLLRKQRGEISGAELSRKAGCKPTAMNNRLARLEQMGLVISRRWGRNRLFVAVKPAREIGSEYA